MPGILSFANGQKESDKPETTQIGGQSIRTLPDYNFLWASSVHYGCRGKYFVVGADAVSVAEALSASSKKEGLLSDARVAEAIQQLDEPIVVGFGSLGEATCLVAKELDDTATAGDKPEEEGKPPVREDKLVRDISKIMGPLPRAMLIVTRKPDRLSMVIRQPGLKAVSAKLINKLVDQAMEPSREAAPVGPGQGVPAQVMPPGPVMPAPGPAGPAPVPPEVPFAARQGA